MNAEEIYRPLGVSPQVCAFGERVLDGLRGALCGRRPHRRGQSGQGACRHAEKPRQRGLLCRNDGLWL